MHHQQQMSVHEHDPGSCKEALIPMVSSLKASDWTQRQSHCRVQTWVLVRHVITSSSACRLFSKFRLKACRAATSASLDGRTRCRHYDMQGRTQIAGKAANLGCRPAAQTNTTRCFAPNPAPARCLPNEAHGLSAPQEGSAATGSHRAQMLGMPPVQAGPAAAMHDCQSPGTPEVLHLAQAHARQPQC